MSARLSTMPRNTTILARLARSASTSTRLSLEKRTSLSTRKTRSRRIARITSSDCAPGKSMLT